MRTRRKLFVVTASVALLIASTAVASQAKDNPAPDVTGLAAAVPQIDQVTQLTEPGVASRPADVTGSAATRAAAARTVCDPGAAWLRPRFSALDLRGGDSVTITGSAGGSLELTARNWPGKAFHTRAFPGSCLSVSADLSDPASRYAIDSYQYGATDLAQATVTVAGAGDICGTACNQTDDLIASINPVSVFTAGDNAYESGTLSEFNNQYAPTWGAFKSKTYPTPGNHEYGTSGAKGYFDYFNGTGNNTGRAGERGKGYYSYDVGDWHFVALNSDIAHGAGSTQEQWLKADLAANTKPCTAAYTHHPRFSGGDHGDDTGMGALVTALYNGKADLFVTGHDHHYERFAPATPSGAIDNANGLRHFVIGTGGRALYSSRSTTAGPSQVFNNNTFGVGKFQLTATGYTMDFVPVAGRTFTDHVTGTCHKASAGPDFGVASSPSSVSVPQGSSASSTVTVSSSGGFSSPVALTASGLPAGVSAAFSPASVTPAANGSATSSLSLSASATAASGTYQVTVTGTSGGVTRTAAVSVTVSPSGSTSFSDDFESDRGWTVNPSGSDTATTGRFERGDPEQTLSTYSDQVKQLGTTPSGSNALSTGRLAGAAYGDNDLDGGVTSVRSPALTVPAGGGLSFAYSVAHGDNSSTADYLRVNVVSGSATTKVWEKLGAAAEVAGAWKTATVDLSAYAGQSVTLLVTAADASGGSLFEAQVDDVKVTGASGAASSGYSVAVFDGVATRD
ncbi:metallophosphoesterase [Phytomonospora endophytica]|uniref:Calcineurin-like phosphoesterase domain-containing protein n=1 Tax=Phytomonospora endophytica TaxID=714109 RepID=A0A841FBC5_9ACTN|nr:metallophosphoesterase [Phytomonospora endophytica]MBB6033084.1 hypothetical protein [Phytomonospora endophytica]GIG65311.1 hypothetical protein Pen01_16060 [Phytomonospora endophytica]